MFRPPEIRTLDTKSVLFIGDCRGEFDFIFERIDLINARHGPFDCAFFVGNFFGESGSKNILAYMDSDSDKKIAIPCYFITADDQDASILENIASQAQNSEMSENREKDEINDNSNEKKNDENEQKSINFLENGGLICPNLTYLGKFGVATINGLKVAYLSGIYDSTQFLKTRENTNEDDDLSLHKKSETQLKFDKYYRANDIRKGFLNYEFGKYSIDILLCNEWPSKWDSTLPKHSTFYKKMENKQGSLIESKIVNKLILKCIPQYVICGLNNYFYQLPPFNFSNIEKNRCHMITNMIGLANVKQNNNNNSKMTRDELIENGKYLFAARVTNISKLNNMIDTINDKTIKPSKRPNFQFNEKYFAFVSAMIDNPFELESKQTQRNKSPKNDKLKRKFEASNTNENKNENDEPALKRQRKKLDLRSTFENNNKKEESPFVCKYCRLSESDISHLIIYSGKYCSLLIPKGGGIIESHFQIVPHFDHVSNCIEMNDNISAKYEFKQIIDTLSDYFRPNYLLFYETWINENNKYHAICNVLPINGKRVSILREILTNIEVNYNIGFEKVLFEKTIESMITSFGYLDIGVINKQENNNKYSTKSNNDMYSKKYSVNVDKKIHKKIKSETKKN